MSETKLSLFVKLVVAILKGDDAVATGIKIQNKAISVLTAQIAVKVCHTLTLEEEVENTERELAVARVNGGDLITDNTEFIKTLLTRRQQRDEALETLKAHKEDIAFLEEELEIAKK